MTWAFPVTHVVSLAVSAKTVSKGLASDLNLFGKHSLEKEVGSAGPIAAECASW